MNKAVKVTALSLLSLALIACGDNTPKEDLSSEKESSGLITGFSAIGEVPEAGVPAIQIHYNRPEGDYANWGLWLWPKNGDGKAYSFNGIDSYGMVAYYALDNFGSDIVDNGLGFIVRRGEWEAKDVTEDRFIDFKVLAQDKDSVYHVYLSQGDANIYIDADKNLAESISTCKFTSENVISFSATKKLTKIAVYENEVKIAESALDVKVGTYALPEGIKADVAKSYTAEFTFDGTGNTYSVPVSVTQLYRLSDFEDNYTYDGELGAIYTAEKTTFRVWSPVSSKITLNLFHSGSTKFYDSVNGENAPYQTIAMSKGERGVFEAEVEGDLEGVYYTYTVVNSSYPKGKEIVDPYARSAGVNGMRGMIVDFSKTNPEGWADVAPHPYDRKELTVYETHVSDVSSSSTWGGTEANRYKFAGLIEEGTEYSEAGVSVKTGFDHIKELGVNAVQLVPIFDQANDETTPNFNWGYNPLNYNVVEGLYSSNPKDGYVRIRELKEVVSSFAKNDINLIMDVVYNHVNGLSGSNFDVLMPGYYFRYGTDGTPTNGSGCGNETASDMPMYRKFMIDSAVFWAREYKLGGFRFDLMGLHDVDTMAELTAAVKEVNPNIVIYGEPWTGGTTPLSVGVQAIQTNARKYVGYGQFNDQMRDALIKGGMSGKTEKGWVNKLSSLSKLDTGKISEGLLGRTSSATDDPDKTVNYVTCHDNYTLFDRFQAAGSKDEAIIRKMCVLANSVVFLSQGTTFMLGGEEFLRTKGGNSNSYNASYEVNEFNYALKLKNLDVFENYQKMIELKQSIAALHLGQDEVKANETVTVDSTLGYIRADLKDQAANKEYVFLFHNGHATEQELDLSGYELVWDSLGELTELSEATPLTKYQTIVASKALAE